MSDDVEVTPLGAAMEEARLEMGLRWSQVAKQVGMTPQNLLRIRKGEIAVTPLAARSIERAFNWPQGRVEALESSPEQIDAVSAPVDDVARAIAAMIDSEQYTDAEIADTIRTIRERRARNRTQSSDREAHNS